MAEPTQQNPTLPYAAPPVRDARGARNRGLHRIALVTTAATFPLIFMGGLVTSHGAGMAVPDWPNTYGYNMFLFPPRLWQGGIFYEHVHRLMGSVVGLLSIVLAVWAWRTESRRWVRWLCTGVLGAVILQGVLGGLRVLLVELDLAIVHACFAQAFFCLAALSAVVTSRWWTEVPDSSTRTAGDDAGRAMIPACVIAVVLIYAQLIVGATMRHYQAGLAVADFAPSHRLIIPDTDPAALEAVNRTRIWKMHLPAVTAGQVWLHMGHRMGAIVVTAAVAWLVTAAIRRDRESTPWWRIVAGFVSMTLFLAFLGLAHAIGSTRGVLPGFGMFCLAIASGTAARFSFRAMQTPRRLLAPAVMLAALLLIQLTLGVLTVLYRKPADVASAHVAVGALTLLTAFVMGARAMRWYATPRSAGAKSAAPAHERGSHRDGLSQGLAVA